ncbi:MAG: RidA family protein [Phycisphaerales bacterium]|jgi:enamine deaminase RidA (YjgF/YER057c/UK114 family)|nr:RidA family protein [Phycisphaerales bacterium]
MTPEQRLSELGLALPPAPAPVAAYVPAVRTGNLVFVSGQIPFVDGELIARGRVPDVVDVEQAALAARACALNGLSVLAAQLEGGLSDVLRIIRIGVFVQCEPGFSGQPIVANGASELLVEIFGNAGRHARAAVGSIGLPLDATVEIELLAEVR